LGAEVKITSVRNGSALPAEVDATSASLSDGELHSVGVTPRTKSLGVCDLGDSLLCRLDERPFLAADVHAAAR
jgi:hypothetical protein